MGELQKLIERNKYEFSISKMNLDEISYTIELNGKFVDDIVLVREEDSYYLEINGETKKVKDFEELKKEFVNLLN